MRQIYPIAPVSAPRMTQRDKWKRRPCVLEYFAFKDQVRAHGVIIPVPCRVIFYIPMPPSWSAKKRLNHIGAPHQQKPDIDNLTKALLDAVHEDDKHVWSIWAEKRWAGTGSISVEAING